MLNKEIEKLIMNIDIREIKNRLPNNSANPPTAARVISYRKIEDYKRDA